MGKLVLNAKYVKNPAYVSKKTKLVGAIQNDLFIMRKYKDAWEPKNAKEEKVFLKLAKQQKTKVKKKLGQDGVYRWYKWGNRGGNWSKKRSSAVKGIAAQAKEAVNLSDLRKENKRDVLHLPAFVSSQNSESAVN